MIVASNNFVVVSHAQTVVKLDQKTNVQGVPFDMPVKLQLPFNKKVNIINISYFKVPRSLYRKYLDGLADSQKKLSNSSFYSQVIQHEHNTVSITPVDSFAMGMDPQGPKYILTLSTPVYLKSNSHYVVGVSTSFMDDDRYQLALPSIVENLIWAHRYLAGSFQNLTVEEVPFFLPVPPHDPDSLEIPWLTLKSRFASNPAAFNYLQQARSRYDILFDRVHQDFGFNPIPAKDIDSFKIGAWYYKVYQSIAKVVNVYDSFTRGKQPIPAFPQFSHDTCSYNFLRQQLSCISCGPNLPAAGFLRDTSRIFSLLNELLLPGSITATYVANQITLLQDTSILIALSQQDDDKLQVLLDKFQLLKSMTSFLANHTNQDTCISMMANKVIAACTSLSGIIAQRKMTSSLKSKYLELLRSDEDFLAVNFFNADTYVYNLNTRYGLRLTSDIGVVDYGFVPNYAYGLGQVTPYLGIHLNFNYIQGDQPFSEIPNNKWYSLRRFSALLGISIFSVKQGNKFDNLFNKNALLLGVGYRFTPAIRMVGGSMLVKKLNPNPLISSTTTASIPFIGVSFDSNTILQSILKFF